MQPILLILSVAASCALIACANGDAQSARAPLRLHVSLAASADVNPDDQQRAAPIVVRLYELKTDSAFNAADFYSLHDKDKAVLTDELVARDEFQLRPGERKVLLRRADPAATVLGVLAAYRDLPNSVWRATYALPAAPDAAWYRRAPQLNLSIEVDTHAVSVVPAVPSR
ncbi:MAG TPA: type VI secretion system lipoprotein TssJ [Paraburkholderia sp.]|nr:type VI secretion system lipoprotein TssJ [Paraburkholderia sp.]